MAKYKLDIEMKVQVDMMQMQYKCCGSKTFTEWFHVSWINDMFVDINSDNIARLVPLDMCIPQLYCDLNPFNRYCIKYCLLLIH